MMEGFNPKHVEISFRKFNDFSYDLESSDNNTFDTHLEVFLHHCENDPIMKVITAPLKNLDTYNKWKDQFIINRGSMIGAGKLNFPTDEFTRDSFLYQLLLKIQTNEEDIHGIAIRCHGANRLDDGIFWFNEKISSKLIRSLKYKLEEIQDRINREVTNDDFVPMNLLVVYQNNSINIGDNVTIEGDAAIGKEAKIEKI